DRSPAFRARAEVFLRDVHRAVGVAVPRRNPVTPPELARDAPGMNVLHPVVVGLRPVAREDRDPPLAHGLDRRLGQGLHLYPPLLRHERLDDGLTAIADADRVAVGLDLLDQPE